MATTIANLNIKLTATTAAFARGMKKAASRVRDLETSLHGVRRVADVTGAALVAFLGFSVKSAAAAQDALNRFEKVFKREAQSAASFAEELARSVKLSKFTVIDALTTFQSFFVGLGFGHEQARLLSQEMSQLTLDFASFEDKSITESLGRMVSALSGSAEVLDLFGINLKQAALGQELMNKGIRKGVQGATEQEKALARVALIARALQQKDAIGDLARTQDDFNNRVRQFTDALLDLRINIGRNLLPAMQPFVARLAIVVRHVGEWASKNAEIAANMLKTTAATILLLAVLPRVLSIITAIQRVVVATQLIKLFSSKAGLLLLGATGVGAGIGAGVQSLRGIPLNEQASNVKSNTVDKLADAIGSMVDRLVDAGANKINFDIESLRQELASIKDNTKATAQTSPSIR